MKREKYLPIGSVCLLKGATKKVMITGFVVKAPDNDEVYDYLGCLYPEGVVSTDKNLLFNHDQIDNILYLGFEDEEETNFKAKLVSFVSKQNEELGILADNQNSEEML